MIKKILVQSLSAAPESFLNLVYQLPLPANR